MWWGRWLGEEGDEEGHEGDAGAVWGTHRVQVLVAGDGDGDTNVDVVANLLGPWLSRNQEEVQSPFLELTWERESG